MLNLRHAEPLSEHTSYHIGGPVSHFLEPENTQELASGLELAAREGLPVLLLGGGTNLLVGSGGFRAMVIHYPPKGEFARLQALDPEGINWWLGAGIALPHLLNTLASQGRTGLTDFAGIPGTLGGAVVMNAGSPSRGFGDFVRRVKGLDRQGREVEINPPDLGFTYRHSGLDELIITGVEAVFPESGEPEEIRAQIRESARKKAEKQPVAQPSAGCVFRNPPGKSAGQLLDQAGCKGMRQGDAEVSSLHANFIVNRGAASSLEVTTLIGKMRQAVKKRFALDLEVEIRVWGLAEKELRLLKGDGNG
ncbi:MAG: UDP-N-acetylmuramate dehydrogenase [Planctomycetota bacterium]|nr:UDP-N-acetylmuramate dehydrogenase [Planctomycetota bacterium]